MMEKGMVFMNGKRLANLIGMAAGGLLSALGGWDLPLRVLIGAMVLDYASGVLSAIREGSLSSAVGFEGLMRKAMILLILMMATALDALTGAGSVCRSAAAAFYTVNEAVSLLENAAKLGLPVPEAITKRLAQLKDGECRREP